MSLFRFSSVVGAGQDISLQHSSIRARLASSSSAAEAARNADKIVADLKSQLDVANAAASAAAVVMDQTSAAVADAAVDATLAGCVRVCVCVCVCVCVIMLVVVEAAAM
jgi:hypothetical protein